MSNRFLWILIIIGFIWVWYLYYNLSYLPEKKLRIEQNLQKSLVVEVKKPELIKQIIDKPDLTNTQKVEDINMTWSWVKENNQDYKTFNLVNNSKAHFIENNSKLDLYLNSNKIWSFTLVYSQYLRVDLISWSNLDLFIEVWADKYFYNNKAKTITQIDLNIHTQYVKTWSENNLIFVTDKWSFIYSIYDKSFEYFSYFSDFVYYNNWYIWLVRESDKRILSNLWFKTKNNLIVYYNPNTKEKKIIYETDLNITKIYVQNNKLFFINDAWEMYELENIK